MGFFLLPFIKRWLGARLNEDRSSKVKLPQCGALDNYLGQTRSHYCGSIETPVINSVNHFTQPKYLRLAFPIIFFFSLVSDVINKCHNQIVPLSGL